MYSALGNMKDGATTLAFIMYSALGDMKDIAKTLAHRYF